MKIIPSPPRAPLSFQSPCMSLDHHSSLMPAAKSKPAHSPLPTVAKQGQRQMVSTAFTGWAASTVIPHWSTSLPAWSPSAHPSPKPLAAMKGRTCLALHAHFLQAKPPFFFSPCCHLPLQDCVHCAFFTCCLKAGHSDTLHVSPKLPGDAQALSSASS